MLESLSQNSPASLKPPLKPFLKWAGGKRQLLDILLKRIPKSFTHYHEPFLGGGALFFALSEKNLLPQASLSDINQDLINSYIGVRDFPDKIISNLKNHIYEKDYYYKIRALDRQPDYNKETVSYKAARTIYLNKSCFNGLYRVNSKGQFNVPFGRYKNPKILDSKNLEACSFALKKADIKRASFEEALAKVKKNDFVYLDPPYIPLSKSSSFKAYSKEGFEDEMQVRLRDSLLELDKKGAKFMLSNSSAKRAKELYQAFNIELVEARRSINSSSNKRGAVQEILVRNYD